MKTVSITCTVNLTDSHDSLSSDVLAYILKTEIGNLKSISESITIDSIDGDIRKCDKCEKFKPIKRFYTSKNNEGKYYHRKTCSDCVVKANREKKLING